MAELDRVADLAGWRQPTRCRPIRSGRIESRRRSGRPAGSQKQAAGAAALQPASRIDDFRVMLAGHPRCSARRSCTCCTSRRCTSGTRTSASAICWPGTARGSSGRSASYWASSWRPARRISRGLIERNEPSTVCTASFRSWPAGACWSKIAHLRAGPRSARAGRTLLPGAQVHPPHSPSLTVIEFFLRARLDKLLGPNLFKEPDVDPYVVAETVWAASI